jgi:hypothetical protein
MKKIKTMTTNEAAKSIGVTPRYFRTLAYHACAEPSPDSAANVLRWTVKAIRQVNDFREKERRRRVMERMNRSGGAA